MTQENQQTNKEIEKIVDEFEKDISGGNCVPVGAKEDGGILHYLIPTRNGICSCKLKSFLRQALLSHEKAVEERVRGEIEKYKCSFGEKAHEESNGYCHAGQACADILQALNKPKEI